jgi:Zn-dependent protease
MTFITLIITGLALLISLTTHEYCHALVSFWLGDTTAKRLGRLTLNPLAHIDLVGTVLVPLIGLLSGFPLIGWAKPVPFNPYNLKSRRWGMAIVGLAGPASNLLGAAVYLIMLKVSLSAIGLPMNNLLVIFLAQLVTVNVVLGIFNLLPMPPLDGSRLMEVFFDSPKYRNTLLFLETRGPMLIFMLILLDSFAPVSVIGSIFNAAVSGFFSLAGL